MVQPKRNNKSILEEIRAQAREFQQTSPVLATRWFVIEHTPARRYHDGYDYTWGRESNIKVSPYFDTEEEAIAWMNEHEPDEGSTLRVKLQNLREYKHKRWGI
jgi:hypothetical protein